MQTPKRGLSSFDDINVPSSLDVLLFFCAVWFADFPSRDKKARALRTVGAQKGRIIERIIQTILKALSVLSLLGKLQALSKVAAPYIIFNLDVVQLRALSLHLDGLALINQEISLADVTSPRLVPYGVGPEAFGKTSGQDAAFRYISYELFNKRHKAIGNYSIRPRVKMECAEQYRHTYQRQVPPDIIWILA